MPSGSTDNTFDSELGALIHSHHIQPRLFQQGDTIISIHQSSYLADTRFRKGRVAHWHVKGHINEGGEGDGGSGFNKGHTVKQGEQTHTITFCIASLR